MERPPEEKEDPDDVYAVLVSVGWYPTMLVALPAAEFDGKVTETVKPNGFAVGSGARVLPIAVT